MEIEGRIVVVTGAASGIGRALARRFHANGAQGVVVADLDMNAAGEVAAALDEARPGSAIAVPVDVGDPRAVDELVDRAEHTFGTVDLFCANAGIALGTDPIETPDDDWDLAWRVNTASHVYAARRLLPAWLDRGDGYFLSTASAAGLLTQIGSAPYSVTKHGAVAFAEWLAITYGDRGVKVSCLCPQGVNTPMLRAGDDPDSIGGLGAAAVRAGGAVLEPEDVAKVVAQAVAAERFLILPHPEVLTYWQRKVADTDRWLAGMRRLQAMVQ